MTNIYYDPFRNGVSWSIGLPQGDRAGRECRRHCWKPTKGAISMLKSGGWRVLGNASAIPRDGNFRSTTGPVFERSSCTV